MVQHLANQVKQSPMAVDPSDEPSAEWGWHGDFPRGKLIAGWFTVAALLLMLMGNHQGHVEDIWLISIAAVIAFGLIRHSLVQRHSWRR